MPQFPKFRQLNLGYLNYDAQTANFTKGKTLTGGTSGATGVIEKDTDAGTTGTLQLVNLSTTPFQNNETITDDNGTPGSATSDGVVTYEEYTWTSWDEQESPAVFSERNRTYYDRLLSTPTGKVVSLEQNSNRRVWAVFFPFLTHTEIVAFQKWSKLRAFWFYPNADLAARYKVEWQTYPFAPIRLHGGGYQLEFVLFQIDEQV